MKPSGIEWIGDIPEEWEVCRVKNYFSNHKIIVGDKSSVYQRLALTLSGVIKRSKEDSSGLQPEAFNGYQILKENELVFKLIDLENISTSRVGLSPFIGIVSPAYIVLEGKNVNMKYSEFYFLSMWQRCIFNQMGDDGVRSSLNSNDLLNTSFVYPPLTEQYQISSYLDTQCAHIDNIIEKTKASIEEYKKLKQAVITQAVTKGIRGDRPMKDSGIEWIGEIPEEWEILKVRYIGTLQNGISKGSEFFGDGFPFVSYGDIYKNYSLPSEVSGLVQTSDDERNLYSVQKGDIFFTRTSETIEEVGFSSVCFKTIPNATFAGFVIRLRPYKVNESVLTEYAKYYFRGEQIRRYLVKEMNLVTRASLGQGLLNAMTVLIPQKQEQQEIAAYLDKKCAEIDAIITKKQQFITEMESYKKSLIFECVTGKREVQ